MRSCLSFHAALSTDPRRDPALADHAPGVSITRAAAMSENSFGLTLNCLHQRHSIDWFTRWRLETVAPFAPDSHSSRTIARFSCSLYWRCSFGAPAFVSWTDAAAVEVMHSFLLN
jgi:hypothetical protein